MKKAFTLLELLIVVGIMSMLGTISVNGYRAVVRGMEERSAISSASAFLRAARQRAQIDNKPICIFWWNEILREETDDEPPVIVGKAVAVQQTGRFTGVEGDNLFDEFSDLNLGYIVATNEPDEKVTMRIYNLSAPGCEYAIVSSEVVEDEFEESPGCYMKSSVKERAFESSTSSAIRSYAFKKISGSNFKAGDAYGFEFASITLPKGYLFGKDYPTSMASPIEGEDGRMYSTTKSTGFEIPIYSLRPKKGKISAEQLSNPATDELKQKK